MFAESSAYEAQHLKEALATDERVGELGLEVDDVQGRLHVRGLVASKGARDAIDIVARELLGSTTVVNETVVKQINDPVEEEPLD